MDRIPPQSPVGSQCGRSSRQASCPTSRSRGHHLLVSLRVGDRHVARSAERLEQVHVVVAASCIAAPEARFDVVHLDLRPASTTVLARALVSRERALARVTPEVVVDEVGAARIAAPASAPGRQRPTTPRAGTVAICRGFAAFDEQAVDHGHRSLTLAVVIERASPTPGLSLRAARRGAWRTHLRRAPRGAWRRRRRAPRTACPRSSSRSRPSG